MLPQQPGELAALPRSMTRGIKFKPSGQLLINFGPGRIPTVDEINELNQPTHNDIIKCVLNHNDAYYGMKVWRD